MFIYPPDSHDIAEAADFQAMLPLYDLVLVPDQEGVTGLPFGKTDPGRIRWVGPIMSRERVELLERWDARERLGAPPQRFVLYVSAGSGSDPNSQELLLSICTAVLDIPDVHIVIGGGPLYFGSLLQGPRITWLNGPSAELMLGFDAAICTAGYNSFNELQFAGVPTAWIRQTKTANDQWARVRRAVQSGTAIVLDAEDLRGSVVVSTLEQLRDPRFRERVNAEGASLAPANFARNAAQAVLSTVWDAHDVEHAATAVDDTVLGIATEMSLPVHAVITLARWISREPRPGRDATRAASTLMDALIAHALHPPLGFEIVKPLCSILPMDLPAKRAQAIISLLDAFACSEDWGATQVFLDSLVPETKQSLESFQATIEALLRTSGDQGMSPQDIAEALGAIRMSQVSRSQSEAIDELMARLRETAHPRRGGAC
ncbi:MAG: glycosyltransferase [Candidatus Binataceae bacterium]